MLNTASLEAVFCFDEKCDRISDSNVRYIMKKNNKILTFVLIGLGLIVLAILIAIFSNGKETRISELIENESVSALYCTSRGIEGAFFSSETANTIENEIKITYHNDNIDKLYYSYNGVYRSSDVTHGDEVKLHAKYNKYMGENGQRIEDLNPSYDEMKTKLHIGLYVDSYDMINEVTSLFFFINKDDISKVKKYSMEEMKKYYEDKSFSCKIVK